MRLARVVAALIVAAGAASPARAVPILVLTKIGVPPVISSGDTATFEILVQNVGDANVIGITLTDSLPAAFSWGTTTTGCSVNPSTKILTCSFSALPAGGVLPVVVTASSTGVACDLYTNTATATSSNGGNPSSNQASLQVNCPALAVTMSSDVFRAVGGDPLGFRIAVSNGGAGTARGVTVSGSLPSQFSWAASPSACSVTMAGILSCVLGDLGPHEARALHVAAQTPLATCGHMQAQVGASSTNGSSAAAFRNVTFAPSGDVDGTCAVAVGDVFYLINFLFAGGAFPQ